MVKRLGGAGIIELADLGKALQPAEDVVMPVQRVVELDELGPDDVTVGSTTEQTPLEEDLARAGRGGPGRFVPGGLARRQPRPASATGSP